MVLALEQQNAGTYRALGKRQITRVIVSTKVWVSQHMSTHTCLQCLRVSKCPTVPSTPRCWNVTAYTDSYFCLTV
jgi:hypothetical protein